MTSNNELLDLIERIRAKGATVSVWFAEDAAGNHEEVDAVTVTGVRGFGPDAMDPLTAAEKIRDALAAISDYENRIDAKQERLEDRADRLRQEGNARVKTGRDAMALIPFGQPILVGHHSESRDRNYRNRAWNNMGKGFETLKQADEVAARAASVGSGGISSDDPTAIAQLREKVAKLEQRQAEMAKANKLVRKHKGNPEAGALAIADAMGWGKTAAAALFTPDFAGRIGFAAYELQNNNANIRRIKERIAYLERNATAETKETETAAGVRIVENAEANRLQLFFPDKPAADVRNELKSCGFRWSPSEGAWQRHLSTNAKWGAERILEKFYPKEAA